MKWILEKRFKNESLYFINWLLQSRHLGSVKVFREGHNGIILKQLFIEYSNIQIFVHNSIALIHFFDKFMIVDGINSIKKSSFKNNRGRKYFFKFIEGSLIGELIQEV